MRWAVAVPGREAGKGGCGRRRRRRRWLRRRPVHLGVGFQVGSCASTSGSSIRHAIAHMLCCLARLSCPPPCSELTLPWRLKVAVPECEPGRHAVLDVLHGRLCGSGMRWMVPEPCLARRSEGHSCYACCVRYYCPEEEGGNTSTGGLSLAPIHTQIHSKQQWRQRQARVSRMGCIGGLLRGIAR